nr:hypothetical protein [Iamia sp. SCSIO 61187]
MVGNRRLMERDDGADSEQLSDPAGSGLVVTGQHDDLGAEPPRLGDRDSGGWTGGVGHADQASGTTVDGEEDGGPAALGELLASGTELAESDTVTHSTIVRPMPRRQPGIGVLRPSVRHAPSG